MKKPSDRELQQNCQKQAALDPPRIWRVTAEGKATSRPIMALLIMLTNTLSLSLSFDSKSLKFDLFITPARFLLELD